MYNQASVGRLVCYQADLSVHGCLLSRPLSVSKTAAAAAAVAVVQPRTDNSSIIHFLALCSLTHDAQMHG